METKTKQYRKLALALIISLLIAFVGATIWCLALSMKFISVIVSYITAFGMLTVYNYFCKDKQKLGFIWCLIWTTLLNTIALIFYIFIKLGLNFIEIIKVFFTDPLLIFESLGVVITNSPTIIINFAISIAFSVIGVISCKKFLEKKQQLQKINNLTENELNSFDIEKEENLTLETEEENNSENTSESEDSIN